MSTVAEIEKAIETLTPAEYTQLLAWMDKRRAEQVDAEFESAILAGKFDALATRAVREIAAGETIPMEEFLGQ